MKNWGRQTKGYRQGERFRNNTNLSDPQSPCGPHMGSYYQGLCKSYLDIFPRKRLITTPFIQMEFCPTNI
jgi:hypothetical protein